MIQCSDGEFKKPHGEALDSEGNVYVSERSGLRIQKFDPDGNFITKWGSEGTGDGQPGDSNRSSINQEATSAQPLIGSGNASQSANNEFVYITDNELFNVYLPGFLSI